MAFAKSQIRLTVIGGLLLFAACAGKPNYSTYEDCNLTNVKANQSREAVLTIRQACRAKFPKPQPSRAEIETAQRAAIKAAAAGDAAQQAADTAALAADAAAAR